MINAILQLKQGGWLKIKVSEDRGFTATSFTDNTLQSFTRRGWFVSGTVLVQGNNIAYIELL